MSQCLATPIALRHTAAYLSACLLHGSPMTSVLEQRVARSQDSVCDLDRLRNCQHRLLSVIRDVELCWEALAECKLTGAQAHFALGLAESLQQAVEALGANPPFVPEECAHVQHSPRALARHLDRLAALSDQLTAAVFLYS